LLNTTRIKIYNAFITEIKQIFIKIVYKWSIEQINHHHQRRKYKCNSKTRQSHSTTKSIFPHIIPLWIISILVKRTPHRDNATRWGYSDIQIVSNGEPELRQSFTIIRRLLTRNSCPNGSSPVSFNPVRIHQREIKHSSMSASIRINFLNQTRYFLKRCVQPRIHLEFIWGAIICRIFVKRIMSPCWTEDAKEEGTRLFSVDGFFRNCILHNNRLHFIWLCRFKI